MTTQKVYIASFFIVFHLVAPLGKLSIAVDVADQEQQQGPVNCGSAGVQVSPMTVPVADSLGLADSYGAVFERPEPGGSAARAGIEAGDVLTTINGVPLEKSSDFRSIIAAWAPGSVVYLNTWRDGQLMTRKLMLSSAPCAERSSASSSTISRPNTEPVRPPKPTEAFDTNQLGQRAPLLLRGIVSLFGQSPKLRAEVYSVLDQLNMSVDDITCTGYQFPGQWNNLAGQRLAPYACDFTNKWLLIEATVTVTGPDGKVYDSITPAATESADTVSQRKPIWVWTTKYHN